MSAIKQEIESLIERLPSDATMEDVQYHLYVMDKVNRGLESIETDGGLTQEEVEKRLAKWVA